MAQPRLPIVYKCGHEIFSMSDAKQNRTLVAWIRENQYCPSCERINKAANLIERGMTARVGMTSRGYAPLVDGSDKQIAFAETVRYKMWLCTIEAREKCLGKLERGNCTFDAQGVIDKIDEWLSKRNVRWWIDNKDTKWLVELRAIAENSEWNTLTTASSTTSTSSKTTSAPASASPIGYLGAPSATTTSKSSSSSTTPQDPITTPLSPTATVPSTKK